VYDVARDFFLQLGYNEQNAVRPTLLVLKRRIKGSATSGNKDYRINLRAFFNPVGNLQIYSTALVTVRCDYDVKVSGVAATSSDKSVFEKEVESLRCHIVKLLHAPIIAPSTLKSCAKISREHTAGSSEEPKQTYRVLPGRIATGYEELDTLLFGGIPENYAVLMTSSSNDERDQIIKKFLTTGAEAGEITFYISVEPGNGKILAEKFQENFYLFICNPRADLMISSLPNVFKVGGVENLNEIDIALTKSFRQLGASRSGPRRACIEILSDVLLQHRAVITRKWLSRLLPELKSKGFTTLAIVNPHMHPREEVHALLGLFEGEIKISEKETEKGIEKCLRIGKLYNQQYLDSGVILKKEKMPT
jgi:KaiC/GvpD/RAD55 family RecA-like ATPase